MAQRNLAEGTAEVQLSKPGAYSEDRSYEQGSEALEKAISSVSFLLDWSSDFGNYPIDGPAVAGLAKILERCAEDLARLRRFHFLVVAETRGDLGRRLH